MHKKILRICTSIDPKAGGVSSAIVQTVEYLGFNGVQVDVLTFDDIDYSGKYSAEFKHVFLGAGISKYQFHNKYLLWLLKNAREYDLVIIDGLWQYHVVGGYVLRILGVPYCVFVHGMLDPYFNQDLRKYIKKLPFWFAVERNILKMARYVLFTADGEMEKAKRSFPLTSFNSRLCSLGFPVPDEVIKERVVVKPKFIFLSRVHPKKGLPILIEAIARFRVIKPVELDIFGDGDETYHKTLIDLVQRNKVSDLISFPGGVYGELKWKVLSGYELFILPSHQENFGIAVAEALAAGVPVLITNKIDIHSDISKFNAGLVVDDTVEGVLEGLEKWSVLTTEEKQIMKVNARLCYESCYTIDIAGNHILRLLEVI